MTNPKRNKLRRYMRTHSRRGITTANLAKNTIVITVVAVFVLAAVTLGLSYAGIKLSVGGSGGSTPGANFVQSNTVTTGNPCAPGNTNSINNLVQHFGADSALTSPIDNRYLVGGGQWVQQTSVSLTDGTTSVGSASLAVPLTTGWLTQYDKSTTPLAYPIWALIGGTTGLQLGQTWSQNGQSLAISCIQQPSGAASGTQYVWSEVATQVAAPASGTSATTNVKALCINSNGNALTTASVSFPTSSTRIDCDLNILQAYKGVVGPETIYGTQSNPVTNYATGVSSNSAPVTVNLVALILANQTAISVSLDGAASTLTPGATLTPDNSNTLAVGTRAWIATLPGCLPASGSTSSTAPDTCQDLALDVYKTTSAFTNHLALQIEFVDAQQVPYLLQFLTTSAITAFGSSTGSVAGAPSGFSSGLTTTGGSNSGNPAPLIKQSYDILNGF